MGVIDLDARVKKLEAEQGGGAVIDQIEADLTALEEQINGDGETDLGLAGDVDALETAVGALQTATAVTDVTNLFTLNPDKVEEDGYYLKAVKVHNTVFVQGTASVSGTETAGSTVTLYTIDQSIRPGDIVTAYALGVGNTPSHVRVEPEGAFKTTGGHWSRFIAFWFIGTTTPTT